MPLLPYSLPPEKSTPKCRFFSVSSLAEVITTCDALSRINNSRQISALRAGTSYLTESLPARWKELNLMLKRETFKMKAEKSK